MHDFYGMRFYFSDALQYGYFVLYLPVVLFIVWILYKALLKKIPKPSIRRGSMVVISLLLMSFPWFQVYQLSVKANVLCEEHGGLKIYKTVEVDGFHGGWDIETASKHGFSYIETGGGQHMNRWTMVDGKPIRESVTEFKSQYQVGGTSSKKLGWQFSRSSPSNVTNIQTGEVLGELVTIGIRPIKLDSFFVGLVGGSFAGWHCGDEAPEGEGSYSRGEKKYYYSFTEVIKATLKPKKNTYGEQK